MIKQEVTMFNKEKIINALILFAGIVCIALAAIALGFALHCAPLGLC